MNNKYAGTKTENNLRAAFAGESQARNQYTFFASVAKKEGYEQMAALFERRKRTVSSARRPLTSASARAVARQEFSSGTGCPASKISSEPIGP